MIDNTQSIQWFPGHMTKARRKIKEVLPLIDAVAEVVDARIPLSSRNPELKDIIGDKPHIILLNKCDMADKAVTEEWIRYYKTQNITAIALDCKTGKGLNAFKDTVKTALADKLERSVAGATGANALGLFEATKEDVLLKEAKVPVAQINVGYLSNEAESALLHEEEYKKMIADGIYTAIVGTYEESLK